MILGECSPLQEEYGGSWHCFPPIENLLLPTNDGTTCILGCYETDIQGISCVEGEWTSGNPGDVVCNLCPPLEQVMDASLSCSDNYIGENTTCQYRCDSEEMFFTGEWNYVCSHGEWIGHNSSFSCHPRSNTESLLVIGGLLPDLWPEFISGVDQYSGSSLENDTVPSLPSGTAYLTAAAIGSLGVSCFGDMHCSEDCPQTECLTYNQDHVWFNPRELIGYIPPQVIHRENAFALAFGEKVWIIGGKHYNQTEISVNTVEIFDPSCLAEDCINWNSGPEIPEPLYDTCAVAYEDDIYVFGGHGAGVWPLKTVIKFNSSIQEWTYLEDMPVDRYGHGCAVYQDKIYISGGYSSDGRLGQVDVFDPKTGSWIRAGDLNIARNNHQMVVVNNQLTVVGGYGAPQSEYWAPKDVDSIEEYHLDIDRWIIRDISLSLPRRSFGAAVVQN